MMIMIWQSAFRHEVSLGICQFIIKNDRPPGVPSRPPSQFEWVHCYKTALPIHRSDRSWITCVYGRMIQSWNPPRRGPLVFHPDVWSQFEITLRRKHWTHNICEGWNHAFNTLFQGLLCTDIYRSPWLFSTINPKSIQSVDSIQNTFALAHRDILTSQLEQFLILCRYLLTILTKTSSLFLFDINICFTHRIYFFQPI